MATIETAFKIIASVVGANAITQLSKNVAGVSTASDNMRRSLVQGAAALRVFAGSIAVREMVNFVKGNIDLADKLDKMSMRTGVAVEQLARYKVAAELSDVSLESMGVALNKLNKNIVEASSGSGAAAVAFKAMGINVRDAQGNLKSADTITGEIADRFKGFPDGPQKAALAMAVFGKSGADLIPLLNSGSEAMNEFKLNIGPEFSAASAAFNDRLTLINVGVQNFGIAVAKQMLPALNDGLDAFISLFNESGSAETFGKIVSEAFRMIVVAASAMVVGIQNCIAILKSLGNFAASTIQKAGGLIAFATGNTDKARELFGAADASTAAGMNVGSDISANMSRLGDIMLQNAAASSLPGLGGGAGKPAQSASKPANNNTPSDILKSMSNFSGGAGEAEKAAAAVTKTMEKWLETQREGIKTLQQESEYIGRTSIEIALMKDAREQDTKAAEEAMNLKGAQREKFLREADAIKQMRQEVIRYNYEQSRTFGAGAQSFFADYLETVTNTAESVKRSLTKAFQSAEDALVQFTTTGKFSFSSFTTSILADIARMQIRQNIMGPLSSAFSSILGGLFGGGGYGVSGSPTPIASANGNIVSSAGAHALKRYSSGGIARTPQISLFGEGSMPEAYVPLPDGRSIPVTMTGGGGGSVGNVYVTVDMSGTNTAQADNATGKDLGLIIGGMIKNKLIDEMRPGGLLAQRSAA